jgi:tetratricopeptide (TPR) repeat protein
VVAKEYPFARSVGSSIVPVELVQTDRAAFLEVFSGCDEDFVDSKIASQLETAFLSRLDNGTYTRKLGPERLYFLAMAYLYGFGVEKDEYRAVRLLKAGVGIAEDKIWSQACSDTLGMVFENGFGEIGAEPLQAVLYLKKLLVSYEKEKGNCSSTLRLYNRIANIYWGILSNEKSPYYIEELLFYREKSAEIASAVYGPNHPATLAMRNNLASCYELTGNYAKASELLKTDRTEENKNNVSIASQLNLAGIYLEEKKYGQAITLFEEAITRCEKSGEATKADKFIAYHNTAYAYFKIRDYLNARRRYEDAEAFCPLAKEDFIYERAFYVNFAVLCFKMKDYEKAITLRKTECKICKSHYGSRSGEVVASKFTQLAKIAEMLGDYLTAYEAYKEAYAFQPWAGFGNMGRIRKKLLNKMRKADELCKKHPQKAILRPRLRFYLQIMFISPFYNGLYKGLQRFLFRHLSEKNMKEGAREWDCLIKKGSQI